MIHNACYNNIYNLLCERPGRSNNRQTNEKKNKQKTQNCTLSRCKKIGNCLRFLKKIIPDASVLKNTRFNKTRKKYYINNIFLLSLKLWQVFVAYFGIKVPTYLVIDSYRYLTSFSTYPFTCHDRFGFQSHQLIQL